MSTPRQDDMDGLILANDLLREENEKLKEQFQNAKLILERIAMETQNTPLLTDGSIKLVNEFLDNIKLEKQK